MDYSVAIRTLGKAGQKYKILLESLSKQTILPREIYVFIPEGYEIPKETIGKEKYIFVKKGMVAQRALLYDEISSEYILFLDDDVFLPNNAVSKLYDALMEHNANVVSPDVFPNSQRPIWCKITMAISGRMLPRKDDGVWAYKVMRNSGYSYNNHPKDKAYLSQTNAGPCFLCRKADFLKINFSDELWMDKMDYALGEDQVMYYKMYIMGLKVITLFGSGIKHLDAGSSRNSVEKESRIIYCDLYFKIIFWHRFIYCPEHILFYKCIDVFSICYILLFTFFISLVKLSNNILKIKFSAVHDAIKFLFSEEYKKIPKI